EPEEQAEAAGRRQAAATDERAEAAQHLRSERAGTLDEPIAQQNVERRQARGAGDGVATEGGDVRQRRILAQGPHEARTAGECAERHAAAEGLGEHDEVRDYVPVLMAEEASRATERRHDLVEDEERADLVTAPAQRRQEAGPRDAHAAL